ncbi:MAG: hypothetical protein WA364_07205 [Candidatus Nitrosopolaris sp.]
MQQSTDYNLDTILKPLLEDKINRYEVLNGFIAYLKTLNVTPSSVKIYMASVKSYFAFYDVDVIPTKFKHKVKMPKSYRDGYRQNHLLLRRGKLSQEHRQLPMDKF